MPTIYTDKQLPARPRNDVYVTPLRLCRKVLEYVQRVYKHESKYGLDPCAGTGAWGQAYGELWPLAHLTGLDIRYLQQPETYDKWTTIDFLALNTSATYDLVFGNPPFNQAAEFIVKAHSMVKFGGLMVFLLPIHFLGGQDRTRSLFRIHGPSRVLFLAQRPNFEGAGRANPNTYCVIIWRNEDTINDTGVEHPFYGTICDWLDWK